MRICLVSNGSLSGDPRSMAEAEALRLAGHEVVGAAAVDDGTDWITTPEDRGVIDRLARRTTSDRVARVAAGPSADIYQPAHPGAMDIAGAAASADPRASVLVKPGWPRPTAQDSITLTPQEPWRSIPASGHLPVLHVPGAEEPSETSRSGSVVVAYRKSERSPGRYLEAALERAGFEVSHSEVIDWDTIDQSTRAVVVVESPLPALRVRGENPGVPVVFWVHHGEHHVDANVRLQRRYGAHAVLLAHSWHLTHRFAGLVDRFPFAVAPELFSSEFRPHSERRWDVGLVGASSGTDGARYSRRERLIHQLRQRLGEDRVTSHDAVPPEEMAELYRDSRVVIDDGAGRHLPITMRVFEATGAGALLFTNPGPGLSQLMMAERDYLSLPDDPEPIVQALRTDTETVARSGHNSVWERHTYDRRVAELMEIVDRVADEKPAPPDPVPPREGLASIVERFADAQRIIDLGGSLTGALPDREVWDYARAEERAEPGTFHVSVVAGESPEARTRAISAARIAVIAPPGDADVIHRETREIHGNVSRHDYPEGSAFTFGSAGYRVSPQPDES